jgi:hypothetical protein
LLKSQYRYRFLSPTALTCQQSAFLSCSNHGAPQDLLNQLRFLNADVELQALGIDPAKLQLNEARQYVALELARACNLPAYFVSAEASSMTYSNSVSERRSLIDFSMKPILTAIEQRLSMPDFISFNRRNSL